MICEPSLKFTEKLLLAEIISINKTGKLCYASNAYFSKRLMMGERTVSAAVKVLQDKGFVISKTEKNYKRTIRLVEENTKEFSCCTSNITNAKFSKEAANLANPLASSANPLAHSATYNNSYNNNKNNSYNYRETNSNDFSGRKKTSYDLEELMKIK